jgi:hypothetical protein
LIPVFSAGVALLSVGDELAGLKNTSVTDEFNEPESSCRRPESGVLG